MLDLRPLMLLAGLVLTVGAARSQGAELPRLEAEWTAWHAAKAELGPTLSGSPAWTAHLEFLEREFAAAGVVELRRREVAYDRWYVPEDQDGPRQALYLGESSVPVASYWAYSGTTGPEGVSAPLLYYDKSLTPEELAGRIVVFDVESLPERMGAGFRAGNVFFTPPETDELAGISSDQWYQSNYVTRFGRFDGILRGSGAAGALVLFDMSPGRAAGLYTFPLLDAAQVGVPGLYLDRVSAAPVRAAARRGDTARLVLESRTEPALSWFLSGILPGRNFGTEADEMVLLITHSDGPNLSQENGTLGILSVVKIMAGLPREERPRSLLILLDPQHYTPGRHTVNWYEEHPELMSRVVATMGIEHLGQREFGETGNDYGLTGEPEPTLIFAQDNPLLLAAARSAMEFVGLPRAELRVPTRGGQGLWQGLGYIAVERQLPGYAFSSGMSGYWSMRPGLESFDVELYRRQIQVATTLTLILMERTLAELALQAEN